MPELERAAYSVLLGSDNPLLDEELWPTDQLYIYLGKYGQRLMAAESEVKHATAKRNLFRDCVEKAEAALKSREL